MAGDYHFLFCGLSGAGLLILSSILLLLGWGLVFFVEQEYKKYIFKALFCLHLPLPVFILSCILMFISETWRKLFGGGVLSLIFLTIFLSLPALYFVVHLFHSAGKKTIWKVFCVCSLSSILSFSFGITLFICFGSLH